MLTSADAAWAAALFAVDPVGLGGVKLRASAGPARDQWLELLHRLLPEGTPVRRMPSHIGDERLLGGLDLAATLGAGRPVLRQGLLAEADGGVVLLAMAERMSPAMAARIAAVVDTQAVSLQREGLAQRLPARIGLVALDEGGSDEEQVPAALSERLGLHLVLGPRAGAEAPPAFDIAAARARLPDVCASDEILTALCEAAAVMGMASVRPPMLALRAACAAAALQGREQVQAEDAALATRLVLGPRATAWPQPPAEEAPDEPAPAPEDGEQASAKDDAAQDDREQPVPPADQPLEDRLLEAAATALPAGLLAQLAAGLAPRGAPMSAGRTGAAQHSRIRGRPIGAHRAELRGGARLDLIQTLRAAAPWQPLRRREWRGPPSSAAVLVRREDFHIKRFKQHNESTTIFAVDASGSQALNRLGEAKGAVELLLAECYVRRDKVALVAFRGRGAELLLPPTRSLVRAKRCLAELPGGGGTPLSAGIDSARILAQAVRRQGGTPLIVLLTDGRANVTRSGEGGRAQAQSDALASARALQAARLGALLLDTSPQQQPATRDLADAMGAPYVPLPHADARTVARAVDARRQAADQAG